MTKDKEAIQIWLDCYNHLRSARFVVDSHPDDDSSAPNVDAICIDSFGVRMAVEHTRIQAFPGEKADNARFEQVLGTLDKHPALIEDGVNTNVSIEVGSIATGISWKQVNSELLQFLTRQLATLPVGRVMLPFSSSGFQTTLAIDRSARKDGQPGYFTVSRFWPDLSNEKVVQKAFTDKLPKLLVSSAKLKILLFEQDSVAGYAPSDVMEYLASGAITPAEMPDEIWWLMTAALETENYAHAATLYPEDRYDRADWKNSFVTSNHPRSTRP
jgi:hypothetical protein